MSDNEEDKKPAAPPTEGAADADKDPKDIVVAGEAAGTDEAEEEEVEEGQEAIAKRVAALGGEDDELDKIARDEEKKLLARKAKSKKGKKGGLEKAASKKLDSIGKRAEPKRVAVAVDVSDPLMARTQKLGKWAKENQKTVTILGALVAVALLGVAGYTYMDHKNEIAASSELSQAVEDERGRIGDITKEDDDHSPKDPHPVFKTVEERREAALKGFKDVESKFPGTGAAILSRLSEGSILLDKKDADGAAAAFNDVKGSPLAAADAEVRGRALEGLGFSYELKASQTPADAAKDFDEAIKVYKDMESSVDVKGFKELAMYHEARCLQAKGDKDGAKALLLTVRERVTKPGENHPFPYLEEVASDRLRVIDPSSVPPKQAGQMQSPTGPQMNDAQLKQLIERLKRQQAQGGGGKPPGGGMPPPHP